MAENTTIAEISAEVTNGSFSPSGLRLDLQVNSFPVVKIDAPANADQLVSAPAAADALATIRDLQEKRLAGGRRPDVGLTVNDGLGGTVTTEGYISAPVLEASKVSTSQSFSAVGVDARLDALDLSIYDAGSKAIRAESGAATKKELQALDEAKAGNLTATLKKVTELLVLNFEHTISTIPFADSRALVEIQHEINTSGPLEIWYDILDNSEVMFEAWHKAIKLRPMIAKDLTNHIKDVLRAKTSGFWGKIHALMSDFQMFYVPTFGGSGKLVRSDMKVDGEPIEIEASVSMVSFADGDPHMLQPGGVVMTGPAAPASRPESARNKDYPQIHAYYPSPLNRGFIQREVPPAWLRGPKGYPLLGSEVKSVKPKLSLKDYIKRRKKGEAAIEDVGESLGGVMTELCRIMFAELQLAHSTVSLALPLDFSMNDLIGTRATITVNTPDGAGSSFTCFVAGVMHAVNLQNGKTLNSNTQVRCTHVKF